MVRLNIELFPEIKLLTLFSFVWVLDTFENELGIKHEFMNYFNPLMLVVANLVNTK